MPADSTDPTFADRYRAASPGVEPRFLAVLAYDAARILFDAIERDIKSNGEPTRAGVAAALGRTDTSGLSGRFTFDANHHWAGAEGWLYQWHNGTITTP
jgi:ABC-type branched-subunit amino acid transport system substrate-binding protein